MFVRHATTCHTPFRKVRIETLGVLYLKDKHSLVLLKKKTITFDLGYLKKMLAERRPNNYKRKKTDKQFKYTLEEALNRNKRKL